MRLGVTLPGSLLRVVWQGCNCFMCIFASWYLAHSIRTVHSTCLSPQPAYVPQPRAPCLHYHPISSPCLVTLWLLCSIQKHSAHMYRYRLERSYCHALDLLFQPSLQSPHFAVVLNHSGWSVVRPKSLGFCNYSTQLFHCWSSHPLKVREQFKLWAPGGTPRPRRNWETTVTPNSSFITLFSHCLRTCSSSPLHNL